MKCQCRGSGSAFLFCEESKFLCGLIIDQDEITNDLRAADVTECKEPDNSTAEFRSHENI